MRNSILLLIFIGFTIISCKKSVQTNLSVQNMVQITPANNTLQLSNLFKGYKIISLKGPALTTVNDLAFKDSLLVIKGKAENSAIHLYSAEGEYKAPLLATGRGSNEAFNIESFKIINPDSIEILADFAQKLFTYSISQHKIVAQRTLPKELMGAEDFIKFDSVRYIFFKSYKQLQENEYKINIFNTHTSAIEQQYLPLTQNNEYISFSQLRHFHSNNDKILFYDVFSPGIYQIHADSLSLYVAFDKGEFDFPVPLLEKEYRDFDEFINVCKQCPYIWGHINMLESNKHILSTYRYKDKLYLNIINKSTMTSQSYTHIYDDLITDETFKISEVLYNIAATEDTQLFTLESYLFKEIIRKKKENGTYNRYKEKYKYPCSLAENITEDDNCFIITFYE